MLEGKSVAFKAVLVKRYRIEIDRELPMKEVYAELIDSVVNSSSAIAD